MKIAGEIGVGSYYPTIVEMNCDTKTFVDGAVVENIAATGLVQLWDLTGDILGVTVGATLASAGVTTCFIELMPKGAVLRGKAENLTAITPGTGSMAIGFAGGGGLIDGALVGMKLKVVSATNAIVGAEYVVTASDSLSGGQTNLTVTGTTKTFVAGDVFEIIDLEDCKATLQGETGVELITDRSKVNFATDWSQGDFTILDIVDKNVFVLGATNTLV